MELIIYILLVAASFTIGFAFGRIKNKDDGLAIINENKVEVIFRDPYEKLIKKRYVNLRIKS